MFDRSRVSPYFLLALLLLLGFASYKVLGVFLNFALGALFLAYITYPGYRWIQSRLRYETPSALLMVLVVAALFLVPSIFLLIGLVQELGSLLGNLSILGLRTSIEAALANVYGWFGQEPPSADTVDQLLQILVPAGIDYGRTFLTGLLSNLTEVFIGVFVLLYLLYYVYLDGPRLVQLVQEVLPLQHSHRDLLIREIANVTEAVVYGHVLTALIQAGLAAFGFYLFGVPNVILWSAIMFILALLPIVGPPLVWGPWGFWLLANGHTFRGIGLLIYSAILVSTLDNVLRPKLIGDRAHVHPGLILLGVLGGVGAFGISGIILGPLVLSIFVSILSVYRREFAAHEKRLGY